MPERPRPKTGSKPTSRVPGSGAARPAEPDVKTRLDGQRGWLNELDRSLKKRSVIALVLTCLAIGASAAAIYISITKNSDSERIDALQTRIESLEAAAGTTTEPEPILPDTAEPDEDAFSPPLPEGDPEPLIPEASP
jgi:hypothetical protein